MSTFSSFAQLARSNYDLVWQDEFDGDYLDMNKWSLRAPGARRDAYNTLDAITVQKGFLAIRSFVRNDSVFTGMISTKNKFENCYGYYEMRCLLPQATGHWASFWLQTPDMGKYIGDVAKAGAEVDIFEFLPNKSRQIHHTLHFDGYEKDHKVRHKLVKNRKFNSQEWHTFGLLWTENGYSFFVDDKLNFTVNEGISKRDQFIILSLEVGKWAGELEKDKLPDYFIIDYVRVYKRKAS
ncbi:MAG: glycoside hydrolase family 16 protein [Chitinophagales bacterium]|nr:glycoside hydrolase family 16 protein [Chitinophagales bacterium]